MNALVFVLFFAIPFEDVESRALTTFLPQDMLEDLVRKEGWIELTLKPFGGIRKGDVLRVWAGGVIDRGGAEAPGANVYGPTGLDSAKAGLEANKLALSEDAKHAAAILVKTEEGVAHPCNAPGKPLEIKLTKENARVWIGFNDEKGAFGDNHLGRGRRHELDPLWIRIEVVRIVVD
ncbi:MAG: hypothetical protein HY040_25880 [Planctomycetes bacterium]|nr:hypothetical protein [Planctomycetota bacterium]